MNRALQVLAHAADYLMETRGLDDCDFPASTPDTHAVVILDDLGLLVLDDLAEQREKQA